MDGGDANLTKKSEDNDVETREVRNPYWRRRARAKERVICTCPASPTRACSPIQHPSWLQLPASQSPWDEWPFIWEGGGEREGVCQIESNRLEVEYRSGISLNTWCNQVVERAGISIDCSLQQDYDIVGHYTTFNSLPLPLSCSVWAHEKWGKETKQLKKCASTSCCCNVHVISHFVPLCFSVCILKCSVWCCSKQINIHHINNVNYSSIGGAHLDRGGQMKSFFSWLMISKIIGFIKLS